jgi:serine/threonine protein kinase
MRVEVIDMVGDLESTHVVPTLDSIALESIIFLDDIPVLEDSTGHKVSSGHKSAEDIKDPLLYFNLPDSAPELLESSDQSAKGNAGIESLVSRDLPTPTKPKKSSFPPTLPQTKYVSENVGFDIANSERLYQGGQGVVYLLTLDSGMKLIYKRAVKTPEVTIGDDDPTVSKGYLKRMDVVLKNALVCEAMLLQELNHPNIVSIEGCGNHDGELMISLEYLEYTLGDVVKARPSHTHLLSIISQMLEGLAYLEKRNIVHCDIKPSNILATRRKNHIYPHNEFAVKFIDFGAARSPCHTGLLGFIHTPFYLDPEALSINTVAGENSLRVDVSPTNDLYALGVTLCEVVSKMLFFPKRPSSYKTILEDYRKSICYKDLKKVQEGIRQDLESYISHVNELYETAGFRGVEVFDSIRAMTARRSQRPSAKDLIPFVSGLIRAIELNSEIYTGSKH